MTQDGVSALAEHVVNSDHEIDWCSAMILDSSRFLYPRRHLESWYIQKGRDVMNSERLDPFPLSTVAYLILQARNVHPHIHHLGITFLCPIPSLYFCNSVIASFLPDDSTCIGTETLEYYLFNI